MKVTGRRRVAAALAAAAVWLAAATGGEAEPDSARVRVFPNPFVRARANRGTVKFEGEIGGATLRVVTRRGLVVVEAGPLAGVRFEWDGRNAQGVPVAPGVYVWIVSGAGATERGRLIVE